MGVARALIDPFGMRAVFIMYFFECTLKDTQVV